MKIYDCFTFYNELELLELRLESLYDYVDYFVLVEADRTQNNQHKPLYFSENFDKFNKYASKIRHVIYNVNNNNTNITCGDWSIENAQRNTIVEGLNDADKEDLILISDLDEFPMPNIITYLKNPSRLSFPLALEQDLYYYNFNLKCKYKWYGTTITKYSLLTTPQDLRNKRNRLPRVKNAGWHFSYMGGIDRIIKKIESTVEGREAICSNYEIINNKRIESCIKNNKDLYERVGEMFEFIICDVGDINLPYLNEFIKKYPYFIK